MEIVKTAVITVEEGFDMFFNDDDDEANDVAVLVKTEYFAEESVRRFSNKQFKEHFRISPSTFEDFLAKLYLVTRKRSAPGHPEIVLEKQAMITIWCLSNMESFRSVPDRFGVSKSTCWSVLYSVCNQIMKLNRVFRIISWLSRQKALRIIEDFTLINGLEGKMQTVF
nr:unnamed protein product [Callosobruchus analis]